ncbi:MAG: hypothetical protein EOO88_08910 [Pedobacter sp.]|nr:MAG: hypothetical protein EOO88_08910 [Pedobacter sp.]
MNSYLETGISLIFVLLIFSVVAYVLQELVAINLQYRAKVLQRALTQLFGTAQSKGRNFLVNQIGASTVAGIQVFYNHAQITTLRKNPGRLPAYIPSGNFAMAVLDLVSQGHPGTSALGVLQTNLAVNPNFSGQLITILKNIASTSTTVQELQQKLEIWYTDYMDRVNGWYKSHTLLSMRLIALGVTLFFNLNILTLAKTIYLDSEMRSRLVKVAEQVADDPRSFMEMYGSTIQSEITAIDSSYASQISSSDSLTRIRLKAAALSAKGQIVDSFTKVRLHAIDTMTRNISSLGIPLGWKKGWSTPLYNKKGNLDCAAIFFLVLGWLITAGCISMGAPFWFDLLGKVVNLRRTGVKPSEPSKK